LAACPAGVADVPPPPNPLVKLLLVSIALTVVVHALAPVVDIRPAPRAPTVVRVVNRKAD